MSSKDEPPKPMGDYWGEDGRLQAPRPLSEGTLPLELLVRLRAQARRRERALRQAEGEAKPVQCVMCEPWPPELRQILREDIEAIPLRATVCEDCMRAWWGNLPWGPPLER